MVLPRFLAELKHRNVYRVAVVYAAVGWALLEVADVVLPRLDLPDWTVNVVLAVLLLGFPLAIVFAWIFDFSPQGIVRTEPLSPAGHPHRFSFVSIAEFVVICVLVVTVGYLYVDRLSLQKRLVEPEITVQETSAIPNPDQYRAIAVLPFADMSEAGDQAWFAEGIAEELLNALARVDDLFVMARTSSFAFKDTDKTIAEIADILGVQAVLEGSVRRSGDRVRISAQLVDASNGFHIWSGSYERQLTDIFQLQDELARAIVKTLRIELGVAPTEPLVAEQTKNVEAYNWFMRGRAIYNWSDLKNVARSISYLEKAVEIDPDYALAWGYIAYTHLSTLGWRPFNEVGPLAIDAYEKALALDSDQSEALASKAVVTQLTQHDMYAAGELYQRAVASRKDSFAVNYYGTYYLPAINRLPQAIRLLADAHRRDPLELVTTVFLGGVLLWSGEAEAAADKAWEVLDLNPEHEVATALLIVAYTDAGNYQSIQRLVEQMPPDFRERPRVKLHIGLYYAAMGNEQKARQIYVDLLDNPPPFGFIYLAELALRLGEVEKAIDIMEREVQKKSLLQFWIPQIFRNNDTVRHHPRYLALLKRIGLDDESVAALHKQMSFD